MTARTRLPIYAMALLSAILIATIIALLGTPVASADDGCSIPPSGPWPPCATGGQAPPPSSNDCAIPPSGPWPPCATGGSMPPPAEGADCVIPPSGPWPPCATAPPPPSDICIVPPSGPWPDCAKDGDAVEAIFPSVRYFWADKSGLGHDEDVTLNWSVEGAVSVHIRPINHTTSLHVIAELAPTGSLVFNMGQVCDNDGTVEFELGAIGPGGGYFFLDLLQISAESFDWFFDNSDASQTHLNPCYPAVNTTAAVQQFENGTMIWLEHRNEIRVLINAVDDVPSNWLSYENSWSDGDAESDESIVAPEGKFQPVRGFGQVWRDNSIVRDSLGWATAPEQGFTAIIQGNSGCIGVRCNGSTFISQPDGETMWNLWYTGSVMYSHQWTSKSFEFAD